MQCPTCRRGLEAREPFCSRCGTEMAPLYEVIDAADLQLRIGERALAAHQPHDAIRAYQRAWDLRHSAAANRGLAVAQLCAGDFRNALRAYVQLRRNGPVPENKVTL